MNRLIIDGIKGISGNSFLGAALSLGLPLPLLAASCEQLLGPHKVELRVEKIPSQFSEIIYFNTVSLKGGKEVDALRAKDALDLLEASSLEDALKERTGRILRSLFRSKARAHGEALEEVRFRYEGMVDTLVDVLGAALTLTYFEAEEFLVSGPIETGKGIIHLPHKELSIPVPMVRFLLEGFHYEQGIYKGEKVTPTGAAILRAFGKEAEIRERFHGRTGFSFPVLPYDEGECFFLHLEEG